MTELFSCWFFCLFVCLFVFFISVSMPSCVCQCHNVFVNDCACVHHCISVCAGACIFEHMLAYASAYVCGCVYIMFIRVRVHSSVCMYV